MHNDLGGMTGDVILLSYQDCIYIHVYTIIHICIHGVENMDGN